MDHPNIPSILRWLMKICGLQLILEKKMTISRYVGYHISSAGDPTTMNTKEFSIQISNNGKHGQRFLMF